MRIRLFVLLTTCTLICVIAAATMGLAASPSSLLLTASQKAEQAPVLPADADIEQIEKIMAALSDEQVRLLLIKHLQQVSPRLDNPQKERGLQNTVANFRNHIAAMRERFASLFSGAEQAPSMLPKLFTSSTTEQQVSPERIFLGITIMLLVWLLTRTIYARKTTTLRQSITNSAGLYFSQKAAKLSLCALLDLVGILVIGITTLTVFFSLFNKTEAGKPVVAVWLLTIAFVELCALAGKFILAPKASRLRLISLTDSTAIYLYQWLWRLLLVAGMGFAIATIVLVQSSNEALYLLTLVAVGIIIASMLSALAASNKQKIFEQLPNAGPAESLAGRIAPKWHILTISCIWMVWALWAFVLVIYGEKALLAGFITLLGVPAYLLMNHAAHRLIDFASDLPKQQAEQLSSDENGNEETSIPAIIRFNLFLRSGFSFFLFLIVLVAILRVWGLELPVGKAVVGAAFSILATLVGAYILWVYISRAIENRIGSQDETEDQTEGEGGGGGGDRLSTLLHLLKKFIFAALVVVVTLILLSSIGVDIGPLLASASIFGIAIGFGAQTLVRDIISGIFFLMDDAFRVGEYLQIGTTIGTVEEITIRSIKLRHHKGPVHIIPYGSIKAVENMSRDWTIMKLPFLVPFDTDVQLVKKIVKRINSELQEVPEYADKLLGKVKSQGVKSIEPNGLQMRVKFMTKPGGQFAIRKIVWLKLRKYFAEENIVFARPSVAVHVQNETPQELTKEQQAALLAAAEESLREEAKEQNSR